MKKWTVYDLFLVFAFVLNVGTRNVYASLILLLAGILELVDTVPKIVRRVKHGAPCVNVFWKFYRIFLIRLPEHIL